MVLDKGVESAIKDEDVRSTHYYGPSIGISVPGEESNLPNMSSLFPKGGPYGNAGSEEYPAIPFTWKNHSGMQTFTEMMDHTDNTPYGNVHKTIHRVFTAPEVDRLMGSNYNEEFLFNPGDESDRMYEWLAMKPLVEYVEIPKFEQLIVDRHEHQPDPVLRKSVTKIIRYRGPNNELGVHLSEVENLRQSLDIYDESREKVRRMSDIQYLGVISIDGVIYSINRLPNGGVVLYTGTKAYEILSQEADSINVLVEDKRTAALGEEATHHARKDYDKGISTVEQLVEVETAAKLALLDHYEKLAEGSGSDTQLREKYMKIVKSIEHDIATVDERYRQVWKQTHGNNEVGDLELVLIAEAYAIGLKTDEEVGEYVDRKTKEQGKEDSIENSSLERTVEDIEDNDSETADSTEKSTVYETDSEYGNTEETADNESCDDCESEAMYAAEDSDSDGDGGPDGEVAAEGDSVSDGE